MKYKLTRFRKDGSSVDSYHRWGYQAHRLGKSSPSVFVWYTISDGKTGYVLCEMEHHESLHRNSSGQWENVTHSMLSHAQRPDELAAMRAGRPPSGGSSVQKPLDPPNDDTTWPPQRVHVPLRECGRE